MQADTVTEPVPAQMEHFSMDREEPSSAHDAFEELNVPNPQPDDE